MDFTPTIERALAKAFEARELDRQVSWYLFEIVVDPLHQGKGSPLIMLV